MSSCSVWIPRYSHSITEYTVIFHSFTTLLLKENLATSRLTNSFYRQHCAKRKLPVFNLLREGRSYIWGNRGGRLGCFQDCCLSESNRPTTSTIFSEREWVHVRYVLSRSPVRLSSVTFVRPTQAVLIFGNISTALDTLAIRSSQGNPSAGGVIHTRGVAKYSDFGPIDGYISETVQDRT